MRLKKFVDESGFQAIRNNLKITPCSHCGKRGMLILHGYYYGFDEKRDRRIVKARRVFCSNRGRRGGCGRTVAIYLADFLRRTLIGASSAWQFLRGILNGSSPEKSYDFLDGEYVLSLETYLRFYKRFKLGQGKIRSFIARHYIPPPCNISSPVLETILCMESCLDSPSLNPVSSFQIMSGSDLV